MKREVYILKERLGAYERAKRDLANAEKAARVAARNALRAIEPNSFVAVLPSVAQANGILDRGLRA